MKDNTGFVAILTSNPALGSIIGMVLDCDERLNVQVFCQVDRLRCHMRIAPVDLVICDSRVQNVDGVQLCMELKQGSPTRRFEFLLLADHVDVSLGESCRFAGVDEVIAKPMSPLFVMERVAARLNTLLCNRPCLPDPPVPNRPVTEHNNVIPLHRGL